MITHGDYDNDGDVDWFTAGTRRSSTLYRNEGDGTVTDVSEASGVNPSGTGVPGFATAFADVDNDSWLDLFVGNQDTAVLLYRNNGDGTFTDIAASAGIARESTEAAVFGDVDNDGWLDLYAGGGRAHALFHNRGDGTFDDITVSSGLDGEPRLSAISALFFDYDNDGDLDLYVTPGATPDDKLYRNEGDGVFVAVAALSEVGHIRDAGWETAASGDIDNDGWLDLAVTNGIDLAVTRGDKEPEIRSAVFRNQGDGTFTGIAAAAPLGHGDDIRVSLADFDSDGFLDLFLNNYRNARTNALYRNRGNGHHWLHIELVGSQSNRSAIGARVTVAAGTLSMTREVGRGETLLVEFGLGGQPRADRVEVRWPSGQVTQVAEVPGDQQIRIIEGHDEFYASPKTVLTIAPDTVQVGAPVALRAVVQPALFEPGAQVLGVTADLSNLGGPEAVPMEDAGDGTYRLQADLPAPERNGRRNATFHVEQQTSLGPYPTALIHSVAVIPPGDGILFGDALSAPWILDTTRRLVADSTASVPAYRGAAALGLHGVGGIWGMAFELNQPISPVGYDALRFAFHPGDVSATEHSFFILDSVGESRLTIELVELLEEAWLDLAVKEWQVVEIDLDVFRGVDIESILFRGNLEGTFHLDDVRLVAAERAPQTAVVEGHQEIVPQAFELAQNYPNPFNSDTVIRYALAQPEHVQLSVYNLAGQQMATLVEGQRPAGVSTVRWDGTDKAGRNLASGVYLYRLQVGSKVETRKLLLLR
ncbi:MAG: T9SS type A sorting domain-containing protein [Candidatus Latescibacteria bacterium]|nr:T9SS type A sorting domain-containing protein [Candidatus Latescibacterota bacterium]